MGIVQEWQPVHSVHGESNKSQTSSSDFSSKP